MRSLVNKNTCAQRIGLSLIELLATLMILSMAAAMAIGIAGPMAAGQRQAAAVDAVAQALDRSRLLAVRDHGAAMHCHEGALRVSTSTDSSTEDPGRRSIQLPAGLNAGIEVNGVDVEHLRFDHLGRCADAEIVIVNQESGVITDRIEVMGISGQMRLIPSREFKGHP